MSRPCRLAALLALVLLSACADGTGPRTPAAVEISTPATELFRGRRMQLSAEVKDRKGRTLPGYEVRWYSDHPTVAVVSFGGEVTAVLPGSARITAVAGAARDTLGLTVTHVPVGSIQIDLGGGYVLIGGLRGVAAYVHDVDGAPVTDRLVEWAVSDTTKATIRSTGFTTAEVRGKEKGVVDVTASIGGKSATARLPVGCYSEWSC